VEENFVPNMVDISEEDKQWGMLCWLPVIGDIMAIIVLLTDERKARPFQKYNAVLSLALRVVIYVISGVLGWVVPCIGNGVLFVVGLVYLIILMLKAKDGEWVEVPWLSDFVVQQGWANKP
jgi:uncharacterized membrane protein